MSDKHLNARGLLAKHAAKGLPLYGNIVNMLFTRGYRLLHSELGEISTFELEGEGVRVLLERTIVNDKPIFDIIGFEEVEDR